MAMLGRGLLRLSPLLPLGSSLPLARGVSGLTRSHLSLGIQNRATLFFSPAAREGSFCCRSFASGQDELLWVNAQEFLRENKIEDAVQLIESGIDEYKSKMLMNRLADIHMATAKYDKVVDVCERALELDTDDRYTFLSMQGEAYDRMKNYDMARKRYEEILEEKPDDSLIMQRTAFLLLNSTNWQDNPTEKYPEVVAAFDRCLKFTADDPENHYGRGLAFFYGRQFHEAIENFAKATDLDSKYAPAWQKKSLAHMAQREFADAIHAADNFLQSAKPYYSKLALDITFGLDDVIFDLMLKRAACYLMIKDYRMAVASIDVMLEREEKEEEYLPPVSVRTEGLLIQAQAYYEEGSHWESVKSASDCIKLDNEFYPAYKIRSEAYAALGRNDSAEKDRLMCIRLAGEIPS